MELLIEAGCPPGVVNFLPGRGEEVGEYLTGHRDVAIIAFTGSKQVGLHILKKAAELQPGQRHLKRCIIEMGGKNAIIVDNDADLDEAIHAILYSAFGFAGQKCSACSRAIVLHEIYDRFLERLVEAARSLKVSFAENPNAYLGPVVDADAHAKILGIIARAKASSQIAFEGEVPDEGYFVPPTIFSNVDPLSPLAQEEIFGPVLAVIKAQNIDQAIEIANNVDYALTGGAYSRSPANIDKIKDQLEVGNMYINRGITGAMVDRHPFGGYKLSGLGSKTGGPDYLINFLEPVVVTENTLRRGFAPSEEEVQQTLRI
jgi:RHH-type proline utilization regulon transcriptional repressor/proline dehydrogenase/delta 1-pyrroline-5-carboxylate dehydrogenase